MKTMYKLTLVVFLIFVGTTVQAQYYKSAVGLRFGVPTSISFKTMLGEKNGIEVNLGTRGNTTATIFGNGGWRYVSATAAYLIHEDLEIDDFEGLRWYYGGGGGIAFYTYDDDFLRDNFNSTSIIVQAFLGLEYTFPDTPVSITTDWAPTILIGDFNDGFRYGYGAVGIRYVMSR